MNFCSFAASRFRAFSRHHSTASILLLASLMASGLTSRAAAQSPVSDDFNATSLNTSLWTVVSPAGGSAAVSNGHLVITVPGGSNHDAFIPGLDAVQVVQPISNGNFDVNVKIDSTLASSSAYSGEGILVEGDAHDYIRYGIGASGSSITLTANTIVAGSEGTAFQLSPFRGYVVPTYLRLSRTGNTYVGYWSTDGVNWTEAGSFTDSLTVTGLAPFAWNYNTTPSNAPAVTASFDWFHNTTTAVAAATPTFTPASGTSFASTLSVAIADSTPGATIFYTTNGSTPTTSSQVYSGPISINTSTTIQALASASGFAQSGIASASYTQSATAAGTPTISPANGTTFSSTLNVSISDATSGATIYYTTNGTTPTTSSNVYSGPVTISTSSTIEAIAGGSGFTTSGVATASYTLTGGSTGGVVSDNLDEASLNTSLWTIENPLGDGTVTMNGSGATLNVPMGQNHDLWTTGDNSVRIMQPISNSDFSVDVRFQSAVEIGNQDEGILVEQDAGDFLRFDVLFNGTAPELFAAGVSGAKATTFVNRQITLPQAPLVLRLARAGNVWTPSWSSDGTNFTSVPGFTFDLNVAKVGPYAGASNSTSANSPAFTAIVDYFFATSDPIANKDGPKPYGYVTVDANPASTIVEKTLADIQGTGHLEPVIGEEEESQDGDGGESGVYWYEYPVSGNVNGPWIKHTIIGSGDAYEDMVAYDVNGDGAVDIICSFDPTFSQKWGFVWFENPRGSGGNPATDTWVKHVIGPGLGENNLVMADIDGDGKLDLVSPSSVFFQNSADSWTQVQYSTSFRGVALLDIGSGNGAIDLAGTQPASPFNAVWWENPRETGGNARTGKWIMHTIGPGYPCSPDNCSASTGLEPAAYAATDVNGDGMMDIISSQSEGPGGGIAPPPGGVLWWQAPADRRNGTWIKHVMDFNLLDAHKIQLGDMDKNGTLDIVVDEQDQSPLDRVVVFYNDGKGNLTEQVVSNGKGHNDDIGDVIGNGVLDILSSGHGFFNDSHPLRIYLNPY